jgi:hypothetical protein
MTLGAFPSAEFLYGNLVVFHVLSKLFIATKVVLQAEMNVFVVSTARQINFGFVVAFDAPTHGQGGL